MAWPKFKEIEHLLSEKRELENDADGSRRVSCICPAHEDSRPSLVILESKALGGRAIFLCQARCTPESVCSAFGFDPVVDSAWAPKATAPTRESQPARVAVELHQRKHLEEYEYRWENGSLNYVVVRHMVPRKDFRTYRKVAGEVVWNLKGVTKSLFRLEHLPSAVRGETLWVVEGEHDVINLELFKECATTKSGGASSKWTETLLDQISRLPQAMVGIICDNDPPGLKTGVSLHELLRTRGVNTRLFRSPLTKEKADITDHLAAGLKVDDLLPVPESEFTSAIEVASKPKEVPVRVASPLDLTETGLAIYLERVLAERVMYVPELDEPWHYECQGIWVPDRDEVDALARAAVERRVVEADHSGDTGLLQAAMRLATRSGISNGLSLMRNSVKVSVLGLGEFSSPHLLPVLNGLVDLRSGELREHDPALRFTMQIQSELVTDAPCSRWLAFLEEVQPDAEVRSWLHKFLGACLTGEMPQIVVCNIGTGLNGKSVAMNTVMTILGDFAETADASTFMAGRAPKANEQRSDLTRLRGKRLVAAAETRAESSLNEGFLKSWSGGEKIVARGMNEKRHMKFFPQGKLILTSNHRPRIREQDLGIWRRIRLVPWTVRIRHVDDRIAEKLLKESDGILAWLIQGAVRFYKEGLDDLPEAIDKATAEYRLDEDDIGEFILERCELGDGYTILSGDLYAKYYEWCEAEKTKAMSKNKFGRRLTQRGLQATRNTAGSRLWEGVKLASEAWDPDGAESFDTLTHR